jgi:maleylpyruvate isomerase
MRRLYGYFRSSAAYRVRIALNLKGLDYEQIPIHLVRNEQHAAAYRALSPQALVPAFQDDEATLTQSLAIVEYLEETHPTPPLLPREPVARAHVRSLALAIACEIHPINNLRVLRYLVDTLKISEEQKTAWYHHWVRTGLAALETQLAVNPMGQGFCHGDAPTLADICLVPQIANARRLKVDLAGFLTLVAIEQNCLSLEAFQKAAPQNQPDAQ